MKCPKCGADIPFYDLKPNCKHCGVNILYYTQDYLLERDAKRTELESAVARMLVAKIKAVFIGSLPAILRMIFLVGAVCALMIPFCSVSYELPYYSEQLPLGLIGIIGAFGNGLLTAFPSLLGSTLFGNTALGAVIVFAFFAALAVIDVVMLAIFLLGFISPDKTTRLLRNASVAACIVSAAAQIAATICKTAVVKPVPYASFAIGFGGMACFLVHLILIIISNVMLKKGVEPVYREYDPKRKELLKKVKAGEVDLDDLSLPIFESEEEHNTRMKEFEQAMEEEAASELEAKIQAKAKAKEQEEEAKTQ